MPVNPAPLPNSERSKRRKKRGFRSLLESSRIHRRAERRLQASQTAGTANHNGGGGVRHPAGTKVDPPTQGKQKTFSATSGGAINYH